jgi:outer membrane lipoprotein-sorting protein
MTPAADRKTVSRRRNFAAALLLVLVAGCEGCGNSSSGKSGGEVHPAGPTDPNLNAAERLLADMIAAYQKADAYADRGELRMTYRRDGKLFEEKAPFSLVLARPNKLQMHLYQGHAVCDGQNLWAWATDLPGFLLRRPVSAALTLGDVYADEVMRGVFHGQVGGSLQLTMLLGADAMELIRAGGERPELLADDSISGRPCRRVRVRRPDGNLTYWIDARTLVLRRIEHPTGRTKRMAMFEGASDVTVTTEFVDPELNPNQISPEAFQFDAPTGVEIVDKLDATAALPKPPPPAQTLGAKLGDFQMAGLDGRPITRGDWQAKTVVVLFWSIERPQSVSALERFNAVYEKYQTRENLVFIAPSIDPGGDAGISDAELRDTLARLKIAVPAARDATHSAVRAFDAQFVPALYVVGPDGRIEDNEFGLNPKLEEELPGRIDRLMAGQTLVAEARARYAERLRQYEASRPAGPSSPGVVGSLPKASIAPAKEPQRLQMARLWSNDEIARPGYVLATDENKASSRIVVADGLTGVAELDAAGKLVRRVELDLPKSPEAVITYWRTTVDKQGRRLFAGSHGEQQQLHVFDGDFQRLLSFPAGTHAGIADVQLGDLDGDGEPEINVGYGGVVGVQNVALDGTRRWANRRLPENVLRLSVTPPTKSGKRLLVCTTGVMSVAILDELGETRQEMRVGTRALRLAAAADLQGDGTIETCGIASAGPGQDSAVGFDAAGNELWNYPLPPGMHPVPELYDEMIAWGKLLADEPAMWIFAAADGSVHLVAADGRPIDTFAWGEPLHGLAVATIDGAPALVLSDAKRVTALRFTTK